MAKKLTPLEEFNYCVSAQRREVVAVANNHFLNEGPYSIALSSGRLLQRIVASVLSRKQKNQDENDPTWVQEASGYEKDWLQFIEKSQDSFAEAPETLPSDQGTTITLKN